jgi:flagellar hook assembly protein FlgD
MIQAIDTTATNSTNAPVANRNRLSREQFLKILTTELTHQNPLEPMDNAQFLEQLVNLQNLETTSAVADGMRSFQDFLGLATGSNLIGKTVSGLADSGKSIEGIVSKVVIQNNDIRLVVGNDFVSLAGLKEVKS